MPRTARASVGGVCYHVLNRGNDRRQVFHEEGDYHAFLKGIYHAFVEIPMPVLAFCLMPNHFHLAVLPENDGDLSVWMHWLQNTHVRRYHKHYHSSGHLWQGRFKAFPVQEDGHLLSVLRYIERNPLRANLVESAEQWPWSSAHCWQKGKVRPTYLVAGPVARPRNWLKWVNSPATDVEVQAIRRSVVRGSPYGDEAWTKTTAKRLGLEFTTRPRGRPRKDGKQTLL